MKRDFLVTFIISAIITIASIYSGALNWNNQFLITGLSFLAGGLLYNKNRNIKLAVYSAIILLPFLLIYDGFTLYQELTTSDRLTHIYPIALIPVIAFGSGILINIGRIKISGKIVITLFVVGLIVAGGYIGMPNWLSYVFNKNSLPVQNDFSGVSFLDASNDTIFLSDINNPVIVLDFWSTNCGICYKKFPEFEKLHQRFINDERVSVYAVNILLKNQDITVPRKNKQLKKYSFPKLYTTYDQSLAVQKAFNFHAVPTLVILKNKQLIYKGGLILDDRVFVNNTNKIINKALE